MLAGFLIGPSVFGWITPGLQQALFPADSMLVVMTPATTLMAYPLVGLVWRHARAGVIDGPTLSRAAS